MKKKLLYFAGIIALIIAIFYFSFAATINQIIKEILVPKDSIGISIKNKSGQNISHIYITSDTIPIDTFGILKMNNNQTMYINWEKGEGTITIKFIFEDGTQIISANEYVEQGYFISKEVKKDTVLSHY